MSLRKAVENMIRNGRWERQEAIDVVNAYYSWGGLTETEKDELLAIIDEVLPS